MCTLMQYIIQRGETPGETQWDLSCVFIVSISKLAKPRWEQKARHTCSVWFLLAWVCNRLILTQISLFSWRDSIPIQKTHSCWMKLIELWNVTGRFVPLCRTIALFLCDTTRLIKCTFMLICILTNIVFFTLEDSVVHTLVKIGPCEDWEHQQNSWRTIYFLWTWQDKEFRF